MKRAMISLLLIGLLGLSPSLSAFSQSIGRELAWNVEIDAPTGASQQTGGKGWPRGYTAASGANIVLYQPQVASWEAQQHMVAYAAVSYLPKGEQKPTLGTLKVETDTSVALEQRLVKFSVLKITEANFQALSKDQTQEIIAEVEKAIPDQDRLIALDRVLAYVDKSQITPRNAEGIKADPPRIFFSKTAAVLVNIDGDAIWSPIKENDLKFAVNSNWDLFNHGPTKTYYLRNDAVWLKTSDLTGGPWTPAGKLPASFNKLPADDNWKDVKANLPGKAAHPAPKVFLSTQPAELILLQGEPLYTKVEGTNLLWVSNTESDVFRNGKNGLLYYLVAGRWFSAIDFNGPWAFATTKLPDDFKKIPLEHPRSRVLVSVPGTEQAAEAVLLAQVPQTARVNKKELKAPEVAYQGSPEFKPIEGSTLERAVNTDKDIIKVGDLYYMCFQGVWFMGRSEKGPWEVTGSVPKQIYEIPASSQSHNVTYVTVEDDDDGDDWVTYATYAGYTGMMIGWGCAVWGTGWYYPPYVGWGGYYPYYYPAYRTYGYGSWYNPHTGIYGTAGRIYGPYGGVGYGARYNASTGTYARGAMAWGPYGARGAAQAWNPYTGARAATRQGSGVYGSWGSTSVQRGDDWANTRRFTNNATGNTTRVTRTDNGGVISRRGQDGGGFVGRGGDNVYAGRDGNVYRRDGSGSWDKWSNGSWNNVQRPGNAQPRGDRSNPGQGGASLRESFKQSGARASQMDRSTFGNLERDSSARSEGAQRTRDSSSYRNRGGGNAGSFRSGGGYSGARSGGYSGARSGGGYGGRGGGGYGGRGGGGRRR